MVMALLASPTRADRSDLPPVNARDAILGHRGLHIGCHDQSFYLCPSQSGQRGSAPVIAGLFSEPLPR